MNPSYSFPWSLRLGTFVFTVNPSLVLLLNCFQKEKKVIIGWMQIDCLYCSEISGTGKWTSWMNSTELLLTTYHSFFSSYSMETWSTESGMLNQRKCTGYENQEKYLLPVLRNMYFKLSQIESTMLRQHFLHCFGATCTFNSTNSNFLFWSVILQ